jgi:hypothetical protein
VEDEKKGRGLLADYVILSGGLLVPVWRGLRDDVDLSQPATVNFSMILWLSYSSKRLITCRRVSSEEKMINCSKRNECLKYYLST